VTHLLECLLIYHVDTTSSFPSLIITTMKTKEEREAELEAIFEDEINMIHYKIHEHIERNGLTQWGLPIVRCDYTSQPRWEEFLATLRKYAEDKYLNREDYYGPLLRPMLRFPIIEDEALLESANWREARHVFNKWVLEDMKGNPLGPEIDCRHIMQSTRSHPQAEHKLEHDLMRAPYWQYFIHATPASISSARRNFCSTVPQCLTR
jgi:hypothetical protein